MAETEARLKATNDVLLIGVDPGAALFPGGASPRHRQVFVTPSDELHEAAAHLALWEHYCWRVLVQKSTSLSEADLKWLLKSLDRAAHVFREAIENFCFDRRFGRSLQRSLREERTLQQTRLRQLAEPRAADKAATDPVRSRIPERCRRSSWSIRFSRCARWLTDSDSNTGWTYIRASVGAVESCDGKVRAHLRLAEIALGVTSSSRFGFRGASRAAFR
jgi:hypothetical protein